MAHSDPVSMMRRETRVREGSVPTTWNGTAIKPGEFVLEGDSLLFRAPAGADFHYRRGEGVVMLCADEAARAEADLWLSGSVYAAIAAINGLIPLHASAVELDGQVIAITGPTGAGKSTLAAALAQDGLPLFCDDTLLVSLQSDAPALCLPGHKRLKLDSAAARLAGAQLDEEVSPSIAKHFASAPRSAQTQPIPLNTVIVLEEMPVACIEEIGAGKAIAALLQDHYTVEFGQLAARGNHAEYWHRVTALLQGVHCIELARPKEPNQFRSILSKLRSYLKKREGI